MTKRKMAEDEVETTETDASPIKKKKVTKKKEENGVKKSPKKTPRARKAPSTGKGAEPKFRLVEMGTQTSPGLAQKTRGRPKKTSS